MKIQGMEFSTPANWVEASLIDICHPKQWKTISASELTEEGYVVYGANGKIGFYSEYTHEKPTLMITCRGATCGNVHVSEPFAYINGNAMALDDLPEECISLKYFYYSLIARKFDDVISGSAQPQITRQGLEPVRVPIPPLAEQKQIAAKLDELLAQVDTLAARLDAIPKILKRFRQSVLAAAVSGRLTEEWRVEFSSQEGAVSAGVVNNDAIDGGAKNKGAASSAPTAAQSEFVGAPLAAPLTCPNEWTKKLFAEIIDEMRNGLSPTPNENEIGTPILRISSVRIGKVDQGDIRYLECTDADIARYALRKGDLLFTRYNGSLDLVGVCALVRVLEHDQLVYPDKLIRVRVNQSLVIPAYIEIYFSSPMLRDTVMGLVKSTSGQKGISGQNLKDMEVSFPPIPEQTQIVHRVEELFAFADQIEQRAKAAAQRVAPLRQSILAKAFRGELTAQWRADNPELISGENSAQALLERIRVGREEKTGRGGKGRVGTN